MPHADNHALHNRFLDDPLTLTYAKTASPIILVMSMSGMLTVADALFLGLYVGPQALAAVTAMFPAYMGIVALASLVSSGMSSLLARRLGGDQPIEAIKTLCGAIGLALALGGLLMLLFAIGGHDVARLAAGGSPSLARLGWTYLGVTVLFSPVLFVLSVNSDALRNEGRVGLMAGLSLLLSLCNIALNFLLIAGFELGVAGSALGTGLAQSMVLAILLLFRWRGSTSLPLGAFRLRYLSSSWTRILALGAPQSLNFLGLALGSAAILAMLQLVQAHGYQDTIAAYGITTRILTFGFLPLLGLSQAMQSITGNNVGAELWPRVDCSLKIALTTAAIYCSTIQLLLWVNAPAIGKAFVQEPAVLSEIVRILPLLTLGFFLAGPLMMIAGHFQALGQARKAALLGLTKPYLFALPLTLILPGFLGEPGIWIAGPLAELLLFGLACGLLTAVAKTERLLWGLFHSN